MRTINMVWIGFLLLVLFGIGTFLAINTSSTQLASRFSAIEASIQQQKWDKAKEDLNAAQQNWGRTKSWWSVFIDHQEIDNIDISLKRLEKYVETQGTTLSMGEVSTLEMLVEHIADTEAPTLTNIL